MKFKFLLCCCATALLAAGLGFGAAYVTGLTVVGVAVSGLGAALGAFAVGHALWGGAVSQAVDAVCAITAKPGSVVHTDDHALEPLFAALKPCARCTKTIRNARKAYCAVCPCPTCW